jgi:hypothetical protein
MDSRQRQERGLALRPRIFGGKAGPVCARSVALRAPRSKTVPARGAGALVTRHSHRV